MHKLFTFFSNISRWLLLPVVSVFLICTVSSEPTLAADPVTQKSLLEMSASGLMSIFSFIIVVITFLAYVFAILVGDLMDSTYILDSGMGDTLQLIWTVMRNFVNVAFILVLLVIAAMVIFGGGGEKGLGMLKKVLPKFILALVFVNLTFFAGRFILSTNDVLATAIFTLPRTVSGEKIIYMPCKAKTAEECHKEISEKFGKLSSGDDPVVSADTRKKIELLTKYVSKEARFAHKIADMVDKKNMALVLITNMLDLEHLVYTKGVVGGGWDIIIGGVMAMVTAGAVAIVIFMLLLALVVRMVVLWLCLAVSPVAALAMVLGDVVPGADMKGDFDLMSIFIKHAFMPTLVAIPLSVGLIMIFANNAVGHDYSMNSLFSFSDDAHAGNFHSLLWWIASIAVIWVGTNAMIKKSSEYASKLTDGIHNGVNKFVGAAAGTLKYAPIMPAWDGESRSVASIMEVPSRVESLMAGQAGARASKTAQAIAPMLGHKPQAMNNTTFNAEVRQATVKDLPEFKALLYELVKKGATSENTFSRESAVKLWSENKAALEKIGIRKPKDLEGVSIRDVLARIDGRIDTKDVLRELSENDKQFKASYTPKETDNKKQVEEATSIQSKEAGKRIEAGKLSGTTPTNIKINDRPVFKVDNKYYFANDDKDLSKGATMLFTEKERKRHLVDLRNDLQDVKDAAKAEEIATRIKKMIDMFGEDAVEQLSDLKFANDDVKEALRRRLEQHDIADERIKSLIK